MSIVNRVICIHQPAFLPWLGYIESMFACDYFVHLDDVQFERGGFQNRNKIKTSNGLKWITLPVQTKHMTTIEDVRIANEFQFRKILKNLSSAYGKAPFFKEMYDWLEKIFSEKDWGNLSDINKRIVESLAQILGAKTKFISSSTIRTNNTLGLNKVKDIYSKLQATHLYSGSGMLKYCSNADLKALNINVIWHDYEMRHMNYNQLFPNQGFLQNLSVVDTIANIGFEKTSKVLRHSANITLSKHFKEA